MTARKHRPTSTNQRSLQRQRQDRERFGFDDIPVGEPDNETFGNIFNKWLLHSFRLDHPDNKLRPVYRFFADRKHLSWIDDLKWALNADIEDDGSKSESRSLTPAQKKALQQKILRQKRLQQQQLRDARRKARHTTTQQKSVPTPPVTDDKNDKSIEININFDTLPKLSSIPQLLKKLVRSATQNKRLVIIAIITILALGAVGNSITKQNPNPKKSSSELQKESLKSNTPEFGTLLPNGKSIKELGGWKRVSPPEAAPVFAYSDKVGDVSIAVSQQSLPDDLKDDTASQMTELAKSFNATDKLTTNNGTIIYIGTSARGPQSVILNIDNLLILIKSTDKIEDEYWAKYVDSLISPIQNF